MPIFWRSQLRIGQDDIDADHRYLILLINTVELVLRFPDQPHHVELALDELLRYAQFHFEREEKIQIAYGYTHLDEHKIEHRRLLGSLEALIAKVKLALADPAAGPATVQAQSGEITALLRHWLVDHVMKADMQMSDMFRKPPII